MVPFPNCVPFYTIQSSSEYPPRAFPEKEHSKGPCWVPPADPFAGPKHNRVVSPVVGGPSSALPMLVL